MNWIPRAAFGRGPFRWACPFLVGLLLTSGRPAPLAAQSGAAAVNPEALRTEYAEQPLSLETPAPKLSWQLHPADSSARGLAQSAYQILVASSLEALAADEGDVWDTGKVASDRSVHVRYDGPPLTSRQRYYWKVRVWDQAGHVSAYSDPAWWEMGLQDASDWSAQWIAAVAPPDSMPGPPPRPAPMFRHAFETDGSIEQARLYISGLGYYEAFLNGGKVGDHVLDPVLTHYDRRVKYVTYDVTDPVRRGASAIGVVLGTGWYNQHTRSAWNFDRAPWRAPPALLAQLEITYANGTRERIATGEDWQVATGPIVFDGIRNGEHYDARKEQPSWHTADFDATSWQPAIAVEGPAGALSPQVMPPIPDQPQWLIGCLFSFSAFFSQAAAPAMEPPRTTRPGRPTGADRITRTTPRSTRSTARTSTRWRWPGPTAPATTAPFARQHLRGVCPSVGLGCAPTRWPLAARLPHSIGRCNSHDTMT